MRLLFGVCALAALASATAPRCTAQAGATRANQDRSTDTLRLSRRQAVADALTRQRAARGRARADGAGRGAARHGHRDSGSARSPPRSTRQRVRSRSAARRRGPSRSDCHDSLPRQVPAQQPNRAAPTSANSQSNYRLQQQTIALAGVGDVRLAARRAASTGRTCATREARAGFSEADAGALRGRHGRQARRDSGAGQPSRSRDNDLIANERDIANAQASLNRTLGRIIGAPIVADATRSTCRPRCPIRRRSSRSRSRIGRSSQCCSSSSTARARRRVSSKEFWLPDLDVRRPARLLAPGIAALHDRNLAAAARLLLAARARRHRAGAALRARARRDVSRHARAGHAGRSLGVRQRQHGDAAGRLPPRRARSRGARSLSRRVHQLQPRRLVRARGAHRAQRAACTPQANSPTHSPRRIRPAPISIARSALSTPAIGASIR